MSQYVPSQEDIDRLVDMAVEQGFERQVSDPSVLAPIAPFFAPQVDAEEQETPEEGAA